MARRITTGISGKNILGDIVAVNNSLQSVVANANVILEPNGTGISVSVTDLQVNSGNSLRLADNDSSNFIALTSPGTVSANITYTLPGTGVAADKVLRTDASGILSWVDPFITINNQTADTATYYPAMTTATSGTVTTASVSNSKLSFVPSTGRLTVTAITAGSATISGGSIDGTTVGATTAATGRFTTIVETSSIAYKENVNPIIGALDAIMQLAGVTYDRKDGSSKNEAGLIKEEVEKVLPNLVKDDGIHYTKLTAYLIEAIKTLKEEVTDLKGNT
jgi:hypothetical protein